MAVTATLRCPICASSNIVVYRIIGGVTWYKCLDCGSKFNNPIIIPDKVADAEKE